MTGYLKGFVNLMPKFDIFKVFLSNTANLYTIIWFQISIPCQ